MFAASSVSWNYVYLLSWAEIFFKERKRFPVRHCGDGAVVFVTDCRAEIKASNAGQNDDGWTRGKYVVDIESFQLLISAV